LPVIAVNVTFDILSNRQRRQAIDFLRYLVNIQMELEKVFDQVESQKIETLFYEEQIESFRMADNNPKNLALKNSISFTLITIIFATALNLTPFI
jgi:hypothetical protein